MKRIAEVIGVARSNLAERACGTAQARGPYFKANDEALLPLIRRFVDVRPTYGYRRITALLNRELARLGLPGANRKRVHRIMQRHALLLEKYTGRREGRIVSGVPAAPFALGRKGRCSKPSRASTYDDFSAYA
jgi:hypothetical protein